MVVSPVALTVAGLDSGGGAGVVADTRTFAAHHVWGTVALTAVTAQNTVGVQAVHVLPAALLRAQIDSVVSDFGADALKTGMLGTVELVEAVVAAIGDLRLPPPVVDPVLRASTGRSLSGDEGDEGDEGGEGVEMAAALAALLVPLAGVVTPNLSEAAALIGGGELGSAADMEEAARLLVRAGARAALVKGGHADWADGSPDCLVVSGRRDVLWLQGPRLDAVTTHGTGCVLSAAIAANLARGCEVEAACRGAKSFVAAAIAGGLAIGHGVGPVNPPVEPPLEPPRQSV